MSAPMATTPSLSRIGHCAQCGCDADHACLDANLIPCSWASVSLCSHCAENIPGFKPGMKVFEGAALPAEGDLPERAIVIVHWSQLGQDTSGLFVACDLSNGLTFRPELVISGSGRAVEIAASILADVFHDDELARELAELFAQDEIRPRSKEPRWLINEFQVRTWVQENRIPY